MNAVFGSSQKNLLTMNSKRLAVFAASMQWADAVKVVSRGNPRILEGAEFVKMVTKRGNKNSNSHPSNIQ